MLKLGLRLEKSRPGKDSEKEKLEYFRKQLLAHLLYFHTKSP